MPFDALVDDILVDVVHWLDRPRDVVNFGLTVSTNFCNGYGR
jgi:hypothetical protein